MNDDYMNAEEVIDVPEEVIEEAPSEEVAAEEAPSEESGGLGFMTSMGNPIQLREDIMNWDQIRKDVESFYANFNAILNNMNLLRNGGSLQQVQEACNFVENAFGIKIDYSEAEKKVSGYELAMMKMQDALAVLMAFMTGVATHQGVYYINGVKIDDLFAAYNTAAYNAKQQADAEPEETTTDENVEEEEA